jgi:hypothetical protein
MLLPEELGRACYFDPAARRVERLEAYHEHFPLSKRDGCKVAVDNAILANRLCNRIDYSISVHRSYTSDLKRIGKAREDAIRRNNEGPDALTLVRPWGMHVRHVVPVRRGTRRPTRQTFVAACPRLQAHAGREARVLERAAGRGASALLLAARRVHRLSRRVALGPSVVRPLAAVAGPEVRIGEGRCRRDRERCSGQNARQHLAPHVCLLALMHSLGVPRPCGLRVPLVVTRFGPSTSHFADLFGVEEFANCGILIEEAPPIERRGAGFQDRLGSTISGDPPTRRRSGRRRRRISMP